MLAELGFDECATLGDDSKKLIDVFTDRKEPVPLDVSATYVAVQVRSTTPASDTGHNAHVWKFSRMLTGDRSAGDCAKKQCWAIMIHHSMGFAGQYSWRKMCVNDAHRTVGSFRCMLTPRCWR